MTSVIPGYSELHFCLYFITADIFFCVPEAAGFIWGRYENTHRDVKRASYLVYHSNHLVSSFGFSCLVESYIIVGVFWWPWGLRHWPYNLNLCCMSLLFQFLNSLLATISEANTTAVFFNKTHRESMAVYRATTSEQSALCGQYNVMRSKYSQIGFIGLLHNTARDWYSLLPLCQTHTCVETQACTRAPDI